VGRVAATVSLSGDEDEGVCGAGGDGEEEGGCVFDGEHWFVCFW